MSVSGCGYDVDRPGTGTRPGPGGARQRLLERVAGALACPRCKAPLDPPAGSVPGGGACACPGCGAEVALRGGQIVSGGFAPQDGGGDWLYRIKEAARLRLGPLYPAALRLLSPVYTPDLTTPFLATFDLARELVADLGSGTHHYGDRVVCVDGSPYPNVHLVADLDRLPLRDGSVSGLISAAVLEHVADPRAHVREMERVLRPGGRVFCYVPFIQGFHASPADYQRFTADGLRQLFDGFELVESRVGAGPTSALLWVFQEWIALVLSFGSRRLYRALLPAAWVLSPLKYLDVLLSRHPEAAVIASALVIEARKPPGPGPS